MKNVYRIDPLTKIFMGVIALDEGDKSPLETDVYLIPAGCIEIPPPDIPDGKIARYVDGDYVLEDIPQVEESSSAEDVEIDDATLIAQKLSSVRAVRKSILDILAGIAIAAKIENDTETTSAYLVVRQGLLDITEDWPTDPDEVDALVMSRYAAMVAQCTPDMVSAFREVVS